MQDLPAVGGVFHEDGEESENGGSRRSSLPFLRRLYFCVASGLFHQPVASTVLVMNQSVRSFRSVFLASA